MAGHQNSSMFAGLLTSRQRTDYEAVHYATGENCWVTNNLAIKADVPPHLDTTVSIVRHEPRKQTIVSWSRIDNLSSLCNKLNLSVDTLNEVSTASIILEAYSKWGKQCVHHLLGDWVFCIWDDSSQEFFIARDHLGHRSLYYYQASDFFVFSTSLSTILDHPHIPKKLNSSAVVQLCSSIKRDAQTFYQNIYQLPCAHTLTLCKGQSRLNNYWLPTDFRDVRYSKDEDYVNHFLELYTEAVRCRIDNSKMGISLSSGLDSGSTATLAAPVFKQQGRALEAFTWRASVTGGENVSFNNRYPDEVPLTQKLINYTGGINLNIVEAGEHNFISVLEKDLELFQEPALFFVHITEIFQAAEKKGIQSLLTGNWGNFIISYPGESAAGFLEMPSGLSNIANYIYQWKKNHNISWLHILNLLLMEPFKIKKLKEKDIIQRNYINPNTLNEELGRYVPFTPDLEKLRVASKGRVRHLVNMMQSCGPGVLSTFANAYGMDMRTPALDKRVIDFCMGIPNSQFINAKGSKILIKSAMSGRMPEELLHNKMRGIQAIDLVEKVIAEASQIKAIFEKLQKVPLVAYWLNIPLLKQLLIEVCSPTAAKETVFMKIGAIQRGLVLGLFLTKFD